MSATTDVQTLTFRKLNHFWLDSGLVGLMQILGNLELDIELKVNEKGLILTGEKLNIQSALEKAYDYLIDRYYNVSTQKQKEDIASYNFYYDSKEDKFMPFPKRKSMGIAELIYNKAPRPSGSSVKWIDKEKRPIDINGKIVKKTRGILPTSHHTLQPRLDAFLDDLGLDVTTSGLLVDGPNEVRPKISIKLSDGKSKGTCYLCGQESNLLEDAKETVFPFITSSSGVLSFNTMGGSAERVCWQCALLGKFVPVNGFYLTQGESLFAFFPYSTSFQKALKVYKYLQDIKHEDPSLRKNFQHPLGFGKSVDGFIQRPFETAFAFLYTLYRKVDSRKKGEDLASFWHEAQSLLLDKAPLEFIVLHAESKGQTSMGKMAWPFRESVYFFRLIKELEINGINVEELMRLLIDFSQPKFENKTLIRNRICERILKKRSVLDLIERHVFSMDVTYIKPLLDFVLIYEQHIKKEGEMTSEERETAVKLGKSIGIAVAKLGKRKGKGDLYKLRKSRKMTDFLSEVNRLQMNTDSPLVPRGVYEGELSGNNFVEFKQFCMIAAMNSFYAVIGSNVGKGNGNGEG